MKKEIINVSRREFLISSGKVGAGLTIGLYLPGCSEQSSTEMHATSGATYFATRKNESSEHA